MSVEQAVFYSISLIAMIGATCIVALLVWSRPEIPGSKPLTVSLLALASWLLMYFLELHAVGESAKIFWNNAKYIGIVTGSVSWLTFTIYYSKQTKWLTKRHFILLSVIPAAILISALTNGSSGLMWSDIHIDSESSLSVLVKTNNWMFWLHIIYVSILLIISSYLLLKVAFHHNSLRGGQRLILVIGLLILLTSYAVYLMPLGSHSELNFNLMFFTMSIHLIITGLFPFQLFSIVPIARNLLIENMKDGMIVLSEDRLILDINSSAQRMIDYKGLKIIGQPLEIILAGWYQQIEPCFSGSQKLKTCLVNSNYMECSVSPMFDQHHQPIGYLLNIRDITEQKTIEAQLTAYRDHLEDLVRERTDELTIINKHLEAQITERMQIEAESHHQKALIERIIATTPNAVVVVNGNAEIVLANKEFYKIFGISLRAKGRSINSIIPDIQLSEAISKSQSRKEAHHDVEIRHTATGIDKTTVATIIPMKRKELLVIFRDVTEERKRQEKMYLTDRLASIGEMAAGVAHELNNPLTGITGLSQLLMENGVSPEVKEDLLIIHNEAKRAAAIVKNMLTFARKHTASKQTTQVNDILLTVLSLRAYEHKTQNIQITLRLDQQLSEITTDGFQMQQVFLNIILNAESAMVEAHQRGHLIITTEQTTNVVRISFKDDGPGIAKENLGRIFDPFFTTKDVGKGTGLGLSICYGIVSEHNGRIYAHSEAGNGTTFVVELPIAKI